jgi:putative endonuclease
MAQTDQVADQIADKRTILWRIGENFAADMLQEQGWHILERNWKAGRYEVDIIALDPEDILVFIEIKTRITSLEPGVSMYGLESITYTKRQKIVASANIYLHHNSLVEKGARLDVVVVNFPRKDSTHDFDIHYMDELSLMEHVHSPKATHIKQAFY